MHSRLLCYRTITTIYCDVVDEFSDILFPSLSPFYFFDREKINKLRHPRVHEKMK